MLLDVAEELVGVAAVEGVDGAAEEVEVDDERDPVGGGRGAARGHERPVEAVGAGEEALEGHGRGRGLGVLALGPLVAVLGARAVGVAGRVPDAECVGGVGRGRLRRLGGLGDRRERLHVRRGPAEQPPRHHGRLGFGLGESVPGGWPTATGWVGDWVGRSRAAVAVAVAAGDLKGAGGGGRGWLGGRLRSIKRAGRGGDAGGMNGEGDGGLGGRDLSPAAVGEGAQGNAAGWPRFGGGRRRDGRIGAA